MREFKVNEYITLKFENRKTNIYVAAKLFRQCKYLLIEIPINEMTSLDEIESIDDAAKRLGHSLENEINPELSIPPEVEFWGHCSNLQAWYENKYNPRLLHSNLAFPLLQKLNDVGDLLARQVLKEELARRLIAGAYSVMDLLINKFYIDFFNRDELWFILNEFKLDKFEKKLYYVSAEFFILKKLVDMGDGKAIQRLKKKIINYLSNGYNSIIAHCYERGYIDYLTREEFWGVFGADGVVLHELEQKIKKYRIISGQKRYVEQLQNFEYFKLQDGININSGPMIFTFEEGEITEIGIFGDERSVAEANHDYYYKDKGHLELEELGESIGKLGSLKKLILRDLGLKKLPTSFENLDQLRILSLAENSEIKLSNSLWKLESLKELDLSMNNLRRIPKSVENLKNLQELYLYGNNLKSVPLKSIEKLKKLQKICVDLEFAKRMDDETYEYLKNRLSVT